MQKVVLVITDGIGYKEKKDYNAFYLAKKPTYDYLFKNTPYSLITTHSDAVGLPEGVMGNSEVGHLSIGSGRVLYQDLAKINNAIKDDILKDNEVLNDAISNSNDIHLAILLSDGGVHSHINHLLSTIDVVSKKIKSLECRQHAESKDIDSKNLESKQIFLHLITDGRDVQPESAIKYLKRVQDFIKDYECVSIATISGRFFAMDRDNRWDRIEKYYRVLVGDFKTNLSPVEYIESSFKESIFDEFIEPASFVDSSGMHFGGIKDGDTFIFLNYRSDRAREIVRAIGIKDFSEFKREFRKINIVCMCEYDEGFNFPILFPKEKIKNTLSEIISKANLTQAHIAETEKYAHVTFFFNGGRELPFEKEERFLVPSPKVKTYDLKPEMSAEEVGNRVIECMEKGTDFIVVNFANGDMVGHTGILEACIKAVEAVDKELGKILKMSEKSGHAIIITSDHGNCEEMRDDNLKPLTNHTVGDVFCFIKAKGVEKVKNGKLSNIAPTILKIMKLEKSAEMDEALI